MNRPLLGPRDVARATGVSTDTLRHYEREGLIPGITRTSAGYRRYTASAVDRVLLIQRALVVGFSLADLKRVLRMRDSGGVPCNGVRQLVGERLAELNVRIDELMVLRDQLRALLVDWDQRLAAAPKGQPVHLLESLGANVAIERARYGRSSRGRTAAARRKG